MNFKKIILKIKLLLLLVLEDNSDLKEKFIKGEAYLGASKSSAVPLLVWKPIVKP